MLNPWWFTTNQGIKVPAGLVIGAMNGIDLGTDWTVWTNANGRFLRGTTGAVSTGSRYGLSANSGAGGGHSGGWGPYVANRGHSGVSSSSSGYPSDDTASVGEHSNHSVSVSYRPSYSACRLIQAQNDAPVPIGGIMFGDAANPDQRANPLTNGRLLYASTGVGTGGASQSAGNSGYQSGSHDHEVNVTRDIDSVVTAYTSVGDAGGSHNHSVSSLSVSANLARCYLRAFEILDEKKIKGLIGMWPSASAIPDGWTLVANMNQRFLILDANGTGTTGSSNSTVSFSGSLSNVGHSHSFSGSLFAKAMRVAHSAVIYHNHSFAATKSYLPERYNIKFIKFTG